MNHQNNLSEARKECQKVLIAILLGSAIGGVITLKYLPGLWWILGAFIGGFIAVISYQPSTVWKALLFIGKSLVYICRLVKAGWQYIIVFLIITIIFEVGMVAGMGFMHCGLFICQHNNLHYWDNGTRLPITNTYEGNTDDIVFGGLCIFLITMIVFMSLLSPLINRLIDWYRRKINQPKDDDVDHWFIVFLHLSLIFNLIGLTLFGLFNPWTAEATWGYIAPYCLIGLVLLGMMIIVILWLLFVWLVIKCVYWLWIVGRWLIRLIFNDGRLTCFVCAFFGVAGSVGFDVGIVGIATSALISAIFGSIARAFVLHGPVQK